jgi:hypothetical protein
MEEDVRKNPGLLKLDLYCRGMRLDDSCTIEEKGGRKILRTRAGLGSGLEVILPGELWTNVPVVEEFVSGSPYSLHWRDGAFWIDHETLGAVRRCDLAAAAWQPERLRRETHDDGRHAARTIWGSTSPRCDYWLRTDRRDCSSARSG